jgi:RNA polymerase sigma-70 factor (ECF subfamily)
MKEENVATIIQRIIKGEREAFALLMERYGSKVYGLAARLVGNDLEAEETTQETFIQAFTHLSDFRGEADFGSWLYRIAYNTALKNLRRRKTVVLPIDDRLTDSVSDEAADTALAEATEERIAMVEAALQRLTPDDRTLVTLFYYEERPTRDIAYVLGTTVSNVTTRLHRVRKRLYLIIKDMEYGTKH